MLEITKNLQISADELAFSYIRSPGPGGQNVNKVATAVLLRFNVLNSSLPLEVKERVLDVLKHRITATNEIIIKASNHRTQDRNRQEAINRLLQLLRNAAIPPKKRKKTKPTAASKERRLHEKKIRSKHKALRGRIG